MQARPNILVMVCDQLRYDSIGFAGENAVCGKVHTPNLDRLAAEGLWFENAYSACPTCCPARECMLAGKRPETFGALWNFNLTEEIPSLTPDHPNWPASMHKAGYNMAYIGKWHVSPTYSPLDFGYDYYIEDKEYANWRRENYPDFGFDENLFGSTDPIPTACSHTHSLADQAIRSIREYAHQNKPWHVRLDYYEPHPSAYPCTEFRNMYPPEDMKPWPSFDETYENKPYIQKQLLYCWENQNKTWTDWQRYVSHYFAMISQIDDAVGNVLNALEETGQADNTVVIFTADHGDMCGSHRMFDKHYNLYDDITRVPLILKAPGVHPRCIHSFVNNCLDMAPTIIDFCGGDPIETDGISWVPLVESDLEEGLRDYALCTLNGSQFGAYTQRMIRTHEWKYIWNLTDVDELYDLSKDPWEMKNLIHEPEVKNVLSGLRRRLFYLLKKEDPDLLQRVWLKRELLDNMKL